MEKYLEIAMTANDLMTTNNEWPNDLNIRKVKVFLKHLVFQKV